MPPSLVLGAAAGDGAPPGGGVDNILKPGGRPGGVFTFTVCPGRAPAGSLMAMV